MQYHFEYEDWNFFYSMPFKVTRDSNLQWLQYRILHRILPINKYLETLKLKDNDLCDFCKNETETIAFFEM